MKSTKEITAMRPEDFATYMRGLDKIALIVLIDRLLNELAKQEGVL